MSGIIFYGTKDLTATREFYLKRVGMKPWLDQADCAIFKHGNLLLGFCQRPLLQGDGIITFFYRTREEIDRLYSRLKDVATEEPGEVEKYGIYRFFVRDPEGRRLEFQHFLYPVEPYLTGDEALLTRRSVRQFTPELPSEELLEKIFELCRFAPTSMNSESYYFIIIKDREVQQHLSEVRGSSSTPIARAPLAVAICADSDKTKRPEQDGCIAAYHFLLCAWEYGLGSCWIADMDRTQVKELLNIPQEHYVATVTPLGFPSRFEEAPVRRRAGEMVRSLG